jgi:hypothetical protein
MLASQKEMKSYSSHQSDNALAGQGEAIENQAVAIDKKLNNFTGVKSEINGE